MVLKARTGGRRSTTGNLNYSLETLQIEKHRLTRTIRGVRRMPVSGDDYACAANPGSH